MAGQTSREGEGRRISISISIVIVMNLLRVRLASYGLLCSSSLRAAAQDLPLTCEESTLSEYRFISPCVVLCV
jgi:hypothetical protein